MELTSSILGLLEPIAVIIAAIAGVWGLTTWRREMIGRRKAELAEETLGCFYEAREVLQFARCPAGFSGEGESRTRIDGETNEAARRRDDYYIPAERLNRRSDVFAKLYASRYRFMAFFGREDSEPFDMIHQVRMKVIFSSGWLVQYHAKFETENDGQRRFREQCERDIGWPTLGSEDDPLACKVEEAVEKIEAVCQHQLMNRRT